MPIKLIMPDVKKRSVGMFQTLFGVNMSIFKGAMAPGSEVTFFLAATSDSTLSITNLNIETHYRGKRNLSSNKTITEIENFFDWIVTLRVGMEVRAKKKVTSLPGAIAPLKMDVLTPNKV